MLAHVFHVPSPDVHQPSQHLHDRRGKNAQSDHFMIGQRGATQRAERQDGEDDQAEGELELLQFDTLTPPEPHRTR